MLLLSDNDILIKLGLLKLLPDFLQLLNLSNEQVYITESTIYALSDQLKKYTKNAEIYQPVLDLVNTFQRVTINNFDLLSELIAIDDIDSGEAILATKLIEDKSARLATSDKRFLKAVQQTEFSNEFQNKVYTFELALLLLIQDLGYKNLKSRILENSKLLDKPVDSLFRLAFKQDSIETDDIECLESFTENIQCFHVQANMD